MKCYEMKKIDFEHCDERGSLSQLVHDGYKQINVLETKKGVTRGGHFHKITSEAFFVVSGSVEVTMSMNRGKETVTFNKGDFFEIKPYVIHSMYFPQDCIMVAMYDIPVEHIDGHKDIYSE